MILPFYASRFFYDTRIRSSLANGGGEQAKRVVATSRVMFYYVTLFVKAYMKNRNKR